MRYFVTPTNEVHLWQRSEGKPVKKPVFSTKADAVAMDALASGDKAVGNLRHGRMGAGITLTLDMAVGRVVCGPVEGGTKKRRAKASRNVVTRHFE